MGLRCVCPQGHVLNIKPELAGKQGICPECGSSFSIEEVNAAPSTKPVQTQLSAQAAGSDQATASDQATGSHQATGSSAVPAIPEAVEWRLANPQGEQFGPTVPTLFAQWITQGRVPPDWLVWRTGWSEWRRADEAQAELPAPLPTANPSETPPPLAVSSVSNLAQKPNKIKPSQSTTSSQQTVIQPSPINEYTIRRKRGVKRQRIVIAVLGILSLALVGLLIWIAMRSSVG